MNKDYNIFSMQEAMRLAGTPAGKELISMLQSQDNSTLQKAADQAAAGNYDQVKQTLEKILSTPEAKSLIEQLRGQKNE